jgi:hypothetical protein
VQRTLTTRLQKLERRYKPDDGAFFVVWASDEAGIDSAITAARSALLVGDGDIVISTVWPRETEPRPSTRWVLKHERLYGAEVDVLAEIIAQLAGNMVQDVLSGVDKDAAAILVADPVALDAALGAKRATGNGRRGKPIAEYTDAALFAAALGRPLCAAS